MMEHNTDRLFWTLTSIIVGALLLTISVKAFPSVASTITAPLQGVIKQGDSTTKTADQAFKDATNHNLQNSQNTDSDAQAKANAVEASTLNLKVTPNGDGTGVLEGPVNGPMSGNLNIPKYIKVNGQLTKITSINANAFDGGSNKNTVLSSVTIPDSVKTIGTCAFFNNNLSSITIPSSVTSIGDSAFDMNQLTSVSFSNGLTNIGNSTFANNQITTISLPNSVTTIGPSAFYQNQISSVSIPNSLANIGIEAFAHNQLSTANVPNSQAYKSILSQPSFITVFDANVNITNNPSN